MFSSSASSGSRLKDFEVLIIFCCYLYLITVLTDNLTNNFPEILNAIEL